MRVAWMAVAIGSLALASCISGATEVIVIVGTDVPADQPMTLAVWVERGSTTISSTVRSAHTWQRTPRSDAGLLNADAGLELPASFAITPTSNDPRNELVTVRVDAVTTAGTISRTARIRFVPNDAVFLRLFLTLRCLANDRVCAGAPCTRRAYCESLGQTCDNAGNCADVTPMLSDAGGLSFDAATPPMTDAAMDIATDTACVPQCASHQCGSDGCGGTCGMCGACQTCNAGTCVDGGSCTGIACGPDSCGHGSCGTCGACQTCSAGACVYMGSCAGRACGPDSCGNGSCGSCGACQTCSGGTCVYAGTCAGIACGPDSCGNGSCGGCPANYLCSGGACIGQCYVRCCDGCLLTAPLGSQASCSAFYGHACVDAGSHTYRAEYGGACIYGIHGRCVGCSSSSASCGFTGSCCGGASGACGPRYCSTSDCNTDCP